jgi:hypothetical protein
VSTWDEFRAAISQTGDFIGRAASTVADYVFPDANTAPGRMVANTIENYGNAVRFKDRVLSTGALVTNPAAGDDFGSFLNSWNDAESISPAQAGLSNPLVYQGLKFAPGGFGNLPVLDMMPGKQNFDSMMQDSPLGDFQHPFINDGQGRIPYVDVTDERVRKAAFEDSPVGKATSGLLDFGIMWYTDPLVIAGKGIKLSRMALTVRPIRTADDSRRAVQEIVEHQAHNDTLGLQGRRTGWGQVVEDLARGSATQNAMHRVLRQSNSLIPLAHLTGEVEDFNTVAMIVRAGLNDKNAINWLNEYHASVADALDIWKGIDPATAGPVHLQNAALAMSFAGREPELGRFMQQNANEIMQQSASVAEKHRRVMNDLVAKDKYLSRFENDLQARGSDLGLKVGAARSAQIEAKSGYVARRRADSFFGDVDAVASETIFQRNPFARAVRYVTWHPLRETPSGWVAFAGANIVDAHKEIMAALDHVPVYTKWAKSADPVLRQRAARTRTDLMKSWFAASDDTSRMAAVEKIEHQVMSDMQEFYNITPEAAGELFRKYSESRASTLAAIKNNVFAIDPKDLSYIRIPQLQSQIAEKAPIMDFMAMDRVIRQNQHTFSLTSSKSVDAVKELIDGFYDIWRPAVLLRLGYTQRNVFEGNLRALAAYGFLPSLIDPVGTLRRFGVNRVNYAKWAKNNITGWGAKNQLKSQIAFHEDAMVAARETAAANRRTMGDQLEAFVQKDDHLYDFMMGDLNRNQFIIRERKAAREANRAAQAAGTPIADLRMRRAYQLDTRYRNGQITFSEMKRLMTKNATRNVPGHLRQLRGSINSANRQAKMATSAWSSTQRTLADQFPARQRNLRMGMEEGGVFTGGAGVAAIANASAARTTESMLTNPASASLARFGEDLNRWGRIEPTVDNVLSPTGYDLNPKYFDELAHVTDQQVKNDAVARMILEGQDDAAVNAWIMSNDRFAKEWRNDMRKHGVDITDPSEHVADLRGILEYYYPTPEIRQTVLNSSLTSSQLKNLYAGIEPSRLPVIHGRVGADGVKKGSLGPVGSAYRGYKAVTGKLYKILGTVPEDVLVRHRFYARIYEGELARLVELDAKQAAAVAGPMSPAQVEAARVAMERSAHRTALKALRETLYTIDRQSNLAAKLRWISPFFAAQENTLRVWSGLALKDPSLIPHAQMIYDAPNRAHMVVDDQFNEIPPVSLPFGDIALDQYLTLPLPDQVSQVLFGAGRLKTTKQSMNFILQGQNFVTPGVSPPLQMAATMFFRDNPDKLTALKDTAIGNMVANTILPFGEVNPDDTWKMMLPPWIDKIVSSLQENGDKAYANAYLMQAVALKTDILNYRLNPSEVPKTPEQFDAAVRERTQQAFFFRAVANLTLPFGAQMDSKYEFYVNEYRNLLKTEPDSASAFAKFTDKYPEFWPLTSSLSKNQSRMSPTLSAYQRYKDNETLAKNVAHDYPDLVGMITNPTGATSDPFNQAVYAWQYDRQILDSNPDITFRSRQSADAAFDDARANLGWKAYGQAKAVLQSWLAQNGIENLNAASAEVKAAWSAQVDQLRLDYPEWDEQRGTNKANSVVSRKIDTIRRIVNDPTFAKQNKSDAMWGIAWQYLEERSIVLDMLNKTSDSDQRKAVREVWAARVEEFTDSDTRFATFYTRYLDYDPEVLPSSGIEAAPVGGSK